MTPPPETFFSLAMEHAFHPFPRSNDSAGMPKRVILQSIFLEAVRWRPAYQFLSICVVRPQALLLQPTASSESDSDVIPAITSICMCDAPSCVTNFLIRCSVHQICQSFPSQDSHGIAASTN
jgi:hypothetical protein